jgi:hypothetical protein
MKSAKETTFPYLFVSMALGIIAAILLVPRSGPLTLQYILKQGRDKMDSFMNHVIKLRDSVSTVRKEGAQFNSRNRTAVEIASEAEKQAFEEQKRNYLGG